MSETVRQANRPTLARLGRDYLLPERWRVLAAIVCMLIVAGMTGITAWLLDPALEAVFGKADTDRLALIALAVLGVSTLKAIAAYGQGFLMADVSRNLTMRLQSDLFARLMGADLARHMAGHSGIQHTNFLQNTSQVAVSFSSTTVGIFRDIPTAISLIAVMFLMDWQLALIAIIGAPLIALLTQRLAKTARKGIKDSIASSNRLAQQITETLQSIRIVKAYNREAYETARAEGLISERMKHYFKAQRASLAAAPMTEAIAGIGVAGAIYFGGMRVLAGTLEASAFITFLATMMWAFQPIRVLSNLTTLLASGLAAAEVIFSEIDIAPRILDKAGAGPLILSAPRGAHVRLENVSFAYGADAAVSGVSLEARPGETVALVGPSGAGKSTIFNLILRLYDPNQGRIIIDGQDIRDVTASSLRTRIGLVAQEAMLFDDTIAANIAYGRAGADARDIEEAARLAAADGFIRALPKGYETRIGEAGGQLSGGQRQRIAIARALLKDAPILLLDEATSALDTESEAKVQEALGTLMNGRTTFVIAHRLSTVLAADRLYVLDHGRVVESGRHGELLARGGLYASLYRGQQSAGEALVPLRAAGDA